MAIQLLGFLVLLGWSALTVLAVVRLRGRVAPTPAVLEPVSVLKPLCGVDSELEANLRSFFEQDHPAFELVFGVQSASDPALALARSLKRQYPAVTCRIVVHDRAGLNPKVSNLRAMLGAVQHDWVVISDSNVRVGCSWLRELSALASEPGTGLVFNPIAGDFGPGLGAKLEALQLNTNVAAGCCVPTELLGHPAVLGKSMLFRRSVFEALGGFESVACVLAEDYVIGRMFGSAGYRVCIAPTPALNVQPTTVRQFVARQLRWAMLRCRLQPLAYALEPLLGPLPLLASGALPLAAAACLVSSVRDAVLLHWMRGESSNAGWLKRTAVALALGGVREVVMLAVWFVAPFVRHVSWRGRRLRLSAGTRLYVEEPLPDATLCHVE